MGNPALILQLRTARVSRTDSGRVLVRVEFSPNCYMYISFGHKPDSIDDIMIEPLLTFLADSGNGVAAEWEPRYGPLQIWTESEKDELHEQADGDKRPPRKHWHFAYVVDDTMAWSQLAVEREGLKQMLLDGDFEGIFGVLQRWASRD